MHRPHWAAAITTAAAAALKVLHIEPEADQAGATHIRSVGHCCCPVTDWETPFLLLHKLLFWKGAAGCVVWKECCPQAFKTHLERNAQWKLQGFCTNMFNTFFFKRLKCHPHKSIQKKGEIGIGNSSGFRLSGYSQDENLHGPPGHLITSSSSSRGVESDKQKSALYLHHTMKMNKSLHVKANSFWHL